MVYLFDIDLHDRQLLPSTLRENTVRDQGNNFDLKNYSTMSKLLSKLIVEGQQRHIARHQRQHINQIILLFSLLL